MSAPRTISESGQYETEVLKSRFICTVQRVHDEAEARAFHERLRKRYWDANHNCYAYIIGEGGRLQKASDDGEPSGTAGVPMLEVLRRRELIDTMAIVTRYFGGTKLGAGGLIRAYGHAVTDAIDRIGVVARHQRAIVEIPVDHGSAGRLENAFRASTYTLAETRYDRQVTFVTQLPDDDVPELNAWLGEQTNGVVQGVIIGHAVLEIPAPTSL